MTAPTDTAPPGNSAAASGSDHRPVVHWERGYRCHGLWRGNERLARVSLGPPGFWKSGRDPYLWETDTPPTKKGEAMTLNAAKKAAEESLNKEGWSR